MPAPRKSQRYLHAFGAIFPAKVHSAVRRRCHAGFRHKPFDKVRGLHLVRRSMLAAAVWAADAAEKYPAPNADHNDRQCAGALAVTYTLSVVVWRLREWRKNVCRRHPSTSTSSAAATLRPNRCRDQFTIKTKIAGRLMSNSERNNVQLL